jgi:hypothetical protein
MPARCDCGRDLSHTFELLGCLACGAALLRRWRRIPGVRALLPRCAISPLDGHALRGRGAFTLHRRTTMPPICTCGMLVEPPTRAARCPDCGAACCRSCTIEVDAQTYCRWCATAFLAT